MDVCFGLDPSLDDASLDELIRALDGLSATLQEWAA